MITEITYETYNNISDFDDYSFFFSGNGDIILDSDAVVNAILAFYPMKVIKSQFLYFVPVLQRKTAQKHPYSNYSQPR